MALHILMGFVGQISKVRHVKMPKSKAKWVVTGHHVLSFRTVHHKAVKVIPQVELLVLTVLWRICY